MLINQETRKVHQFARQTLRGKKCYFRIYLYRYASLSRVFSTDQALTWSPATPELGSGRTLAVRARGSGELLPSTSGHFTQVRSFLLRTQMTDLSGSRIYVSYRSEENLCSIYSHWVYHGKEVRDSPLSFVIILTR